MNTLVPLRMKDKERLMRIYGTLSRGVDFINSPDIKISRKTSMSTAIDGYQEIEKNVKDYCLKFWKNLSQPVKKQKKNWLKLKTKC